MTSRAGKIANSLPNGAGHTWPARNSRVRRIGGGAREEKRDCGFADRIEARAARHGRRDCGFTYTVVLIMLIALGFSASAATQLGSQRMLAEREVELLFRGLAYQRAIKSYYEQKIVSPNTPALPRNLEDLLKDPRVQHRSHLRALYPDPFTPVGENGGWRVLRADDGGILGVASQSRAEPRRQTNFPRGLERLAGARAHADWLFVFTPPTRVGPAPTTRGTPQAPASGSTR